MHYVAFFSVQFWLVLILAFLNNGLLFVWDFPQRQLIVGFFVFLTDVFCDTMTVFSTIHFCTMCSLNVNQVYALCQEHYVCIYEILPLQSCNSSCVFLVVVNVLAYLGELLSNSQKLQHLLLNLYSLGMRSTFGESKAILKIFYVCVFCRSYIFS